MREFIKEVLGVELTEELAKKLDEFLELNYVSINEYIALEAENEKLMSNSGKFSDSPDFQLLLEEKTGEIREELEAEYLAKLEAVRFDYLLELALEKEGIIDSELIKVKLDLAKLSLGDKNEIIGLEEQLLEVKKLFPMLFLGEARNSQIIQGKEPIIAGKVNNSMTKSEFNKLNYSERADLLRLNPVLYYSLV